MPVSKTKKKLRWALHWRGWSPVIFQALNMWNTMSVNKEMVPWVSVWALMALKPVQTGRFWHVRSTLGALKTCFSFWITELYFITKLPKRCPRYMLRHPWARCWLFTLCSWMCPSITSKTSSPWGIWPIQNFISRKHKHCPSQEGPLLATSSQVESRKLKSNWMRPHKGSLLLINASPSDPQHQAWTNSE